jgi:hypothetical protein
MVKCEVRCLIEQYRALILTTFSRWHLLVGVWLLLADACAFSVYEEVLKTDAN